MLPWIDNRSWSAVLLIVRMYQGDGASTSLLSFLLIESRSSESPLHISFFAKNGVARHIDVLPVN